MLYRPFAQRPARKHGAGYRLCLPFLLLLFWLQAAAHPSPNSIVFLDISPGQVAMEVQLPVPELELAWGRQLSGKPEQLLQPAAPQLLNYLKAHILAYTTEGKPWQVKLTTLQLDRTNYQNTNVPYPEIIARLVLVPNPGEDTRHFFLQYDVILHQVVTHTTLLSLRSDWENGTRSASITEASVIRQSLADGKVYPVEINLEQGSHWKGFKSMFVLGMQHIREGTDHLLFLLVLLLPAMLRLQNHRWGIFGGIGYSIRHLLQIVTAFTIGHSATLLVSAAGWIQLPQQPVEILIAFSILISAIHALYPLFPGRELYVAGGFGLIHGLAFATVLADMKLTAGTLALSIAGFNLGIEAMQLLIVLLVLPWLMLLSTTPFYKWIRIAGALAAVLAALAWTAERSLGKANRITMLIQSSLPYAGWSLLALAVTAILLFFFTLRQRSRQQSYR